MFSVPTTPMAAAVLRDIMVMNGGGGRGLKRARTAGRWHPADGGAVRMGTCTMDGAQPWYPCVTAAAYNAQITKEDWLAGRAAPLRAVTMDGEELSIASNDPALTVYGLDLSLIHI